MEQRIEKTLKKVKTIYTVELLAFSILFLVLGILKILNIWNSDSTRRLIFNILTTCGSLFIIGDFFFTLFNKERRKKKCLLDKIIALPGGLFLLTYDILCFSNVIPIELNGYFVGGVFIYLSLVYAFQAIYHYKHPLQELIDAAIEAESLTFTNSLIDTRFESDLKNLYESSFPEDEKVPYDLLLAKAKEEKISLLNVVKDDEFVGLAFVVNHLDITFLFYLAVKEEERNQGIGSSILSYINNKYKDNRVIINIEALDEKASNYDERLKRKAFYERNGFVDLAYQIREYGVTYEMFSIDGKMVTKEEYIDLMSNLFDRESYLKAMKM